MSLQNRLLANKEDEDNKKNLPQLLQLNVDKALEFYKYFFVAFQSMLEKNNLIVVNETNCRNGKFGGVYKKEPIWKKRIFGGWKTVGQNEVFDCKMGASHEFSHYTEQELRSTFLKQGYLVIEIVENNLHQESFAIYMQDVQSRLHTYPHGSCKTCRYRADCRYDGHDNSFLYHNNELQFFSWNIRANGVPVFGQCQPGENSSYSAPIIYNKIKSIDDFIWGKQ